MSPMWFGRWRFVSDNKGPARNWKPGPFRFSFSGTAGFRPIEVLPLFLVQAQPVAIQISEPGKPPPGCIVNIAYLNPFGF